MVMQTAPEDNNTTVHRNVITFLGAYQIMRKLYGLIGVLFHYLDAYQEYEKSVRHSQVYNRGHLTNRNKRNKKILITNYQMINKTSCLEIQGVEK
jgi:hypothetical protein